MLGCPHKEPTAMIRTSLVSVCRAPAPLALACVLAVSAPRISASAPAADLIIAGGDVVTMNPRQPEAAALAVRGGRIIAVGSRDDVLKLQGPATQLVELQGRALLPGFVAAHE